MRHLPPKPDRLLGGRQGVPPKLSRNVTALGLVSLCMGDVVGNDSLTVLGVSILFVGLVEGTAEATTSLVKIFSGRLSDGLGRGAKPCSLSAMVCRP
jgi:hypothetical protein